MHARSVLPRMLRPEVYQGGKKPKNYFEGWYFKLVDRSGEHIWSFIAGVSHSDDSHCFVQAIHANSGKTYYCRYSLSDFSFSRKSFQVKLGPNEFSSEGMKLDLINPELKASGSIRFQDTHPFPSSITSPGIMGWYSYAPRMECYHGVVSMQHGLSGDLDLNGVTTSFEDGKGYIEKDWGRSMPSDWIWMQSNHFKSDPEASFMLSVARIPWINGFFPGFLSFLKLDGKLYRFATYNRSVIQRIELTDEEVRLELYNKKYILNLTAFRKPGGVLKAPRHGAMDREIKESIVSKLDVELKDQKGHVLFKDTGEYAGLEIVGDVAQYFRNND